MAATSDDAVDSLLSTFDEIYQDFKDGVSENQSLRVRYIAEVKKREALEDTIRCLKSEIERLTGHCTESFRKLADKIELRTGWQHMKEELKRVNDEHLRKENEYSNSMELLKKDHAQRIEELESQIRGYQIQVVESETAMNRICQDLAAHRNHVEFLKRRLEEVPSKLESKYCYEIQDLKDCLLVEREEKNQLSKRLHDLQKELLIRRSNLAEQNRDSASDQHVETLKQKVMKLRKENEILKRNLRSE